MKSLVAVILMASLCSCKDSIPKEKVFEGFVLGENFSKEKVESKLGKNALTKYHNLFKENGLEARIDIGNNTWEYFFKNGTRGFVSFRNTNNVLTSIYLFVGEIYQPHPNKKGFDDYYTIRQVSTRNDINYLKTLLKNKYGKYSDSSGIFNNPDLRFLTWRFQNYTILFCYDEVNFYKCNIEYYLNGDIKDRLEKSKDNRELEEQSDKL